MKFLFLFSTVLAAKAQACQKFGTHPGNFATKQQTQLKMLNGPELTN